MKHKKPIIGLAGGVGAGKSTVAAELAILGGLVISSDRLNHEVLRRPEVIEQLRRWWGDRILGADGLPDRSSLAEIVFADPEQKRRLESLIHPLIAACRLDIIHTGVEDQAVRAIILDSPLLFETNLNRHCDAVLFIIAAESQRLHRVQQTRGWDIEELRRREASQLPLADKRSRADFVIRNEGNFAELRAQITEVFNTILSGRSTNP